MAIWNETLLMSAIFIFFFFFSECKFGKSSCFPRSSSIQLHLHIFLLSLFSLLSFIHLSLLHLCLSLHLSIPLNLFPLLFPTTITSFCRFYSLLQSVKRARRWGLLPAHITAVIWRNANSLQPDPVSLQCYPNRPTRAVQPPWNEHHECFRHSYWDISIFIVRNPPYFTTPSPAAPITLALLGLEQHIFLILGRVSTQCISLKEDMHWRLMLGHWRSHTGRNINHMTFHFWHHFANSFGPSLLRRKSSWDLF